MVLQPLALPSLSTLTAHTAAFRAALAPVDIAQVALARDVFQASWILPLGLYFLFEPAPRKWPITISWTIRKGVPKLVHHACWLSGWLLFVAAGARVGDTLVTAFLVSMFVTGALSVILCPIGVSPLKDKIHWVASLLYMVDHAIVFSILGTKASFVRGFWSCFALMVGSYAVEKKQQVRDSVDLENSGKATLPAAWETTGAVETAAAYGFMLGEYGLFVFFLCGMASGLAG